MSGNKDQGTFRVWLPTFKQGDDFSKVAEGTKDAAEAFKNLADLYFEVGGMCRRLASVLFENPGFTADGDGHFIHVEGPRGPMLPLIQDGIAEEEIFEDEDFDDSYEEPTNPNIKLTEEAPEQPGDRCVIASDPWMPTDGSLPGWWHKSY